MRLLIFAVIASLSASPLQAQASRLDADVDSRVPKVMNKVIAWRRDIHEHPELSNRETRTADLVAQHLRSLGIEVRTGVAHTGVVGVLRGGKPGPVVALRADMDALPVAEEVDIPFASKVRTTYNGQEVGVMHACGHDTHTAMLMGVAEVLAGMRSDIQQRVRRTAEAIAQSAGATAQITIDTTNTVTYNDPALTEQILPTLRSVAGTDHVVLASPTTTAEDFSRYQQRIPGVFFFLGITPPGTDSTKVAPNHSPRFYVDEAAFPVGVRVMAHLAVDYLSRGR